MTSSMGQTNCESAAILVAIEKRADDDDDVESAADDEGQSVY
jgi:hypothetical protein